MKMTWKNLLIMCGVLIAIVISLGYLAFPHSIRQATTTPTDDCSQFIIAQEKAINSDPLVNTETFDKYPVASVLQTTPANLDTNSNAFAHEFRSALKDQLSKAGVNFAGHYSIVDVGMTGWGASYYIVDRNNGKAYTFPYEATFLDFREDSNLILMNSKQDILNFIQQSTSPSDPCMSTGTIGVYYTDARPFYLLWQDNKLQVLGSGSSTPPVNPFWTEFK